MPGRQIMPDLPALTNKCLETENDYLWILTLLVYVKI